MVKVTKLGRGSELGSKLRRSDSNLEWLRQEIGRTAPPDLLLCPGLSSDKELSREEEPGTRKICKGVENRKSLLLGFSLPPAQGAPGTQQRGRRGRGAWLLGDTQPLCQALNGLSAVTVPIFPDLHHPSRRLMVVGSPECTHTQPRGGLACLILGTQWPGPSRAQPLTLSRCLQAQKAGRSRGVFPAQLPSRPQGVGLTGPSLQAPPPLSFPGHPRTSLLASSSAKPWGVLLGPPAMPVQLTQRRLLRPSRVRDK